MVAFRIMLAYITIANLAGIVFQPFGALVEWGLSSFFLLGFNLAMIYRDIFD